MSKPLICPVCNWKSLVEYSSASVKKGYFICDNCSSRMSVEAVGKYLTNNEYNTHHTHKVLKKEVTPEMRELHFAAHGTFVDDSIILEWCNTHEV